MALMFLGLTAGGLSAAVLPPPAVPVAGTNASSSTVVGMADLDDIRQIMPGDKLSFRIVEDQEDAHPLLVKDSGQVDIPYIGLLSATNKTCKQLALEAKASLEKEYYYQATVVVVVEQLSRSRGKVYLVGAVRVPGPQDLPSDETLTAGKVVMRAGGFTEFADKKRVKITRHLNPDETGSKVIVVNLTDVLEKGIAGKDEELRPGDLIYVPERAISF